MLPPEISSCRMSGLWRRHGQGTQRWRWQGRRCWRLRHRHRPAAAKRDVSLRRPRRHGADLRQRGLRLVYGSFSHRRPRQRRRRGAAFETGSQLLHYIVLLRCARRCRAGAVDGRGRNLTLRSLSCRPIVEGLPKARAGRVFELLNHIVGIHPTQGRLRHGLRLGIECATLLEVHVWISQTHVRRVGVHVPFG